MTSFTMSSSPPLPSTGSEAGRTELSPPQAATITISASAKRATRVGLPPDTQSLPGVESDKRISYSIATRLRWCEDYTKNHAQLSQRKYAQTVLGHKRPDYFINAMHLYDTGKLQSAPNKDFLKLRAKVAKPKKMSKRKLRELEGPRDPNEPPEKITRTKYTIAQKLTWCEEYDKQYKHMRKSRYAEEVLNLQDISPFMKFKKRYDAGEFRDVKNTHRSRDRPPRYPEVELKIGNYVRAWLTLFPEDRNELTLEKLLDRALRLSLSGKGEGKGEGKASKFVGSKSWLLQALSRQGLHVVQPQEKGKLLRFDTRPPDGDHDVGESGTDKHRDAQEAHEVSDA